MLIWAPIWGWVIAANVLLGINQGLTWSTTVVMKIDLVGPRRRGLAMGLNEAAGYVAVAATALLTGYLAAQYGLRPAPFLLGLAFAALGLRLSGVFVRETRDHARLEAGAPHPAPTAPRPPARRADRPAGLHASPASASRRCRRPARPGWSTTSTTAWPGACSRSCSPPPACGVASIGMLVALYPAVWGLGQMATGALSDRWGRKQLITAGMLAPGRRLALDRRRHTASPSGRSAPCCSGPAPPWSTPPCSPSSATSPTRPGGPAPSASTGSGATAATPSAPSSPASPPTCSALRAAVWVVAAITAASGLVVAVRMYETHPADRSATNR